MNSVINILLFFVFILMLATSFVAINIYINKTAHISHDVYRNIKNTDIKESNEINPSSWVQIFAKQELHNFSYPSSELFISLDFSDKKRTNTLKITNLDSYKFFCLNEILKSNNIKFAYQKIADSVILEVVLDGANLKNTLINELNKYNISYSIQ